MPHEGDQQEHREPVPENRQDACRMFTARLMSLPSPTIEATARMVSISFSGLPRARSQEPSGLSGGLKVCLLRPLIGSSSRCRPAI
jgi:hypothetical protein